MRPWSRPSLTTFYSHILLRPEIWTRKQCFSWPPDFWLFEFFLENGFCSQPKKQSKVLLMPNYTFFIFGPATKIFPANVLMQMGHFLWSQIFFNPNFFKLQNFFKHQKVFKPQNFFISITNWSQKLKITRTTRIGWKIQTQRTISFPSPEFRGL